MRNKITLNEYINSIENKTGIKIQLSQISEIIGRTKQFVSQYKNKVLPEEHFNKLEVYFSKYNLDNSNVSEFVELPIRSGVEASMGYGVTVYNEEQTATYSISKKLLGDLGANYTSTEMIFAKGDSMSPTIEGGDSILIDLSKIELYEGLIYCIRIDGQLYIKRLQRLNQSTILIISDNQKYKTREINLKDESIDFKIIGEVRWWGRVAR